MGKEDGDDHGKKEDPTGVKESENEKTGRDTVKDKLLLKLISLNWMIVGAGLNIYAYESVAPLLVSASFVLLGLTCLMGLRHDKALYAEAFISVYSTCWFWAGVAAIYANYFKDASQNLDAAYFYEMVSAQRLSGMETLLLEENAGALAIWQLTYDFFYILGLEIAPYIGICLNSFLVGLSAAVGVSIVKLTFGNDRGRIDRFTWLCSFCGIFWLFGSLHLRDAAILFVTTGLLLAWVWYLREASLLKTIVLLVVNGFAGYLLGMLRTEYAFLPFAFGIAGVFAFFNIKGTAIQRAIALGIAGIIVTLVSFEYLTDVEGGFFEKLERNRNTYEDMSHTESTGASLGNTLIVNQDLIPRLILGSVYLLIFPIPIWKGFQLETVYHLFKSLHAVFMYFVTPLFLLGSYRIIMNSLWRQPLLLFPLLVFGGLLLATAYTSLETRHVGSFLVPFLLISLIPDLNSISDRRIFKRILSSYLALMGGIHLTWFFLKA
jgi:hypothetical protein